MKWRFRSLSIVFIFAFSLLVIRLGYWQIIKGANLAAKARDQQTSGISISAPRGNILASDNSFLAANQDIYVVYAYLPDIKDNKKTIGNTLAAYFVNLDIKALEVKKAEEKENKVNEENPEDQKEEIKIDKQELTISEELRVVSLLEAKNTTWVPLKKRVDAETKKSIESLHIEGIGFDKGNGRFYPEGSMASQTLGFTGKDDEGEDQGYFGLEGYYDLTLKGKKGFLERESNALGIPILIGRSKSSDAQKGVDLLTNIDKFVQLKVEEKLKDGEKIQGFGWNSYCHKSPKWCSYGAASMPSYNPERYFDYSTMFQKSAISDS
jgi:stage V sporulation protein D (sporulation-specific penicillin-binding protein)